MRIILLMEQEVGKTSAAIALAAGIEADITIVRTLDELSEAIAEHCDLLLSFGTGVIVPRHILHIPGLVALNVHPASPEYPGRDPHHFAIYHDATGYGATLHFMEEFVDSGEIIDVELFPVPDHATPAFLLEQANAAGFKLIKRLFEKCKHSGIATVSPKVPKINWASRKNTRKDFLDLCKVDCSMSQEEFNRRLRAVAMPGYNNLYMDIHGHRFRIDSSNS